MTTSGQDARTNFMGIPMQRRQFTPAISTLFLARSACLALLGESAGAFALGETEAASGVRAALERGADSAVSLLGKPEDANVEQYVTRKALDGLFFMIGQEEKKIRADPAGTGSAILKAVFGGH